MLKICPSQAFERYLGLVPLTAAGLGQVRGFNSLGSGGREMSKPDPKLSIFIMDLHSQAGDYLEIMQVQGCVFNCKTVPFPCRQPQNKIKGGEIKRMR